MIPVVEESTERAPAPVAARRVFASDLGISSPGR
jgi:hypothetical protein